VVHASKSKASIPAEPRPLLFDGGVVDDRGFHDHVFHGDPVIRRRFAVATLSTLFCFYFLAVALCLLALSLRE
jgi:hypothetical protein